MKKAICYVLMVFSIIVFVYSFFSHPLPETYIKTDYFAEQRIVGGRFLNTMHYIKDAEGIIILPIPIYKYIPMYKRISLAKKISPFAEGTVEKPSSVMNDFTNIYIEVGGKQYISTLIIPDKDKGEYIRDYTYTGMVELMSELAAYHPQITWDKYKISIYKWIYRFGKDIKGVSIFELENRDYSSRGIR